MGVWDMMYLMQQYKRTLERSDNSRFSDKARAEYADKAEVIRQHMSRYLAQVELASVKGSTANPSDSSRDFGLNH